MHDHGFSWRMLAGLVQDGLVAAEPVMMMAGDRAIAVVRVRITAAARRTIEG